MVKRQSYHQLAMAIGIKVFGGGVYFSIM